MQVRGKKLFMLRVNAFILVFLCFQGAFGSSGNDRDADVSCSNHLKSTSKISSKIDFLSPEAAGLNHIELGCVNHVDVRPGDPDRQFFGTWLSIKEMVGRYGKVGRIYLNDLDAKAIAVTAEYLKNKVLEEFKTEVSIIDAGRAKETSTPMNRLEIVIWPGDMTTVELPKTKTSFLRNPNHPLLKSMVYQSFSNIEDTELYRLIQASTNGLYLIFDDGKQAPIYDPNNPPMSEVIADDYKGQPVAVDESYFNYGTSVGLFGVVEGDGQKVNSRFFRAHIKPQD